jgi:ribonuclease HI
MWTAYTDGACRGSNPGTCSCAFAVFDDDLKIIHQQGRYLGPELRTNNFAEYSGLIDLLHWAYKNKVTGLQIFCDSKLVVEQVKGSYACTKADLQPLQRLAYALFIQGRHSLTHIRGHEGNAGNELVDRLCNEVLDEVQGKGNRGKDV